MDRAQPGMMGAGVERQDGEQRRKASWGRQIEQQPGDPNDDRPLQRGCRQRAVQASQRPLMNELLSRDAREPTPRRILDERRPKEHSRRWLAESHRFLMELVCLRHLWLASQATT
jgi:hypothetical protein